MPVPLDAFNKEMARVGTFSEVCENYRYVDTSTGHHSPLCQESRLYCLAATWKCCWGMTRIRRRSRGWLGLAAALATPRTINKIGFCGFVQPPNSVTLLATLWPCY